MAVDTQFGPMEITIVCANAYWGRAPHVNERYLSTRYRYVLEFRDYFNPFSKPPILTPKWAIKLEQYYLGWWKPNYPVPMCI